MPQDDQRKRKVLVTGAAGNIGTHFVEQSHTRYDLRLMVRPNEDAADVERIREFGEIVSAELADLERMKIICQGIDTVLHLAANPSPSATWDSVRDDQILVFARVQTDPRADATLVERLVRRGDTMIERRRARWNHQEERP